MSHTLSEHEAVMNAGALGSGLVKPMNPPPSSYSSTLGNLIDKLFGVAAFAAACLTLLLLFGILISLLIGAWPAIDAYGLSFLTRTVWDPVKND